MDLPTLCIRAVILRYEEVLSSALLMMTFSSKSDVLCRKQSVTNILLAIIDRLHT